MDPLTSNVLSILLMVAPLSISAAMAARTSPPRLPVAPVFVVGGLQGALGGALFVWSEWRGNSLGDWLGAAFAVATTAAFFCAIHLAVALGTVQWRTWRAKRL